jgi:mono/diheme cytochrome c family protein
MKNLRPLLLLLLASACQTPPKIPQVHFQHDPAIRVDVVAAEPGINTPVAIDFDATGRMWVVEMPGYMANLDNTDEGLPCGRIQILEDRDRDGFYEKQTRFLDSLILPRAIALVYGGLLYAEPPNLWFQEIGPNDQPGKRTLVDSLYATGGNVEHQPNGLIWNIDNWIYSAKSSARYRLRDGVWEKEATAFRGQWGITKDDWGRLYYNDNSNQFKGDWLPPNTLLSNPYYQATAGLNVQICPDQRVYPLHPTAVNRGYLDGMLDSTGRLIHATSACGPLIYRGDLLPDSFQNNSLVCLPEGNLIKRNILSTNPIKTRARQAYENVEFIASEDLAFRPVNLKNGPDGAVYVVDMHRGIIQHKTYMTAYLREKITALQLDTVVNFGRILRISGTEKKTTPLPDFSSANVSELVDLFQSPNGWVRDKAQQELVFRQDKQAIPFLKTGIENEADPRAALHALWTLEGMHALDQIQWDHMLQQADPMLSFTSLRLAGPYADCKPEILESLHNRGDSLIDLGLALYAHSICQENALPLLNSIAQKYPQEQLFIDAFAAGLEGHEQEFIDRLSVKNDSLIRVLKTSQKNRLENKLAHWASPSNPGTDGLTRGLLLYQTHCGVCHGATGQGNAGLAPPLDQAPLVTGDPEKLILVGLFGLEGPVHVNGVLDSFPAAMPGLAENPDCSDEELADILYFIRNAFSPEPHGFKPEDIARWRKQGPPNGKTPTEISLLSKFDSQ